MNSTAATMITIDADQPDGRDVLRRTLGGVDAGSGRTG
jgi:hypothetical protein